MGPLVSIVTPSLNQGRFIRATIDSVLAQTYHRIEYRILDGGSSDETLDVLSDYRGRVDWRWKSGGDGGQAAAINSGFHAANGDILMWLNSDDTLLPWAVEWAVAAFHRNPRAGVVYGDTVFTDEGGAHLYRSAPTPFDYWTALGTAHNPIPQPSAFIHRRALGVGPLDTSLTYFFDWDYWLRIGARMPIVHETTLASTYRLHPAAKTSRVPGYELIRVTRRHTRKRTALASAYRQAARYYAVSGRRVAALAMRAMYHYYRIGA